MPDLDTFEYLTDAAFSKNRTSFTAIEEVRFFADDNNETGAARPIALDVQELSDLIGGLIQYVHTEPAPGMTTWTVTHNIGTTNIADVQIYVGGELVFASVTIVDENSLTIEFAVATFGTAIIKA